MKKFFSTIFVSLVAFAALADITVRDDTAYSILNNVTHADNSTTNYTGPNYILDLGQSTTAAFQLTFRMLGTGTNTYKAVFERSIDKINWAPGPTFGFKGIQTNLVSGVTPTNVSSIQTNFVLNGDKYWRLSQTVNDNAGSKLTNVFLRVYGNTVISH